MSFKNPIQLTVGTKGFFMGFSPMWLGLAYMNGKNIPRNKHLDDKRVFKYYILGIVAKASLYTLFAPISLACMTYDYHYSTDKRFSRHFRPLSVYFKD